MKKVMVKEKDISEEFLHVKESLAVSNREVI